MTFELYAVLTAILIGLIHLSAASFWFKAQVGNQYTVGPRDQAIKPIGVAARLQRAQSNFNETFPYFAACGIIVTMTDTAGELMGCNLLATSTQAADRAGFRTALLASGIQYHATALRTLPRDCSLNEPPRAPLRQSPGSDRSVGHACLPGMYRASDPLG